MSRGKTVPVSLLLILTGAILFLPFLGRFHLFDWDEVNFAECAREMIAAKRYLLVTINYLPFWEKPPLFIWMQALSMKFFGIGDYAARLPNAICGIATMFVLYNTGKVFKDGRFGLLWVLAYMGSILPFFYFKSGIIDPWFNLFIYTGFYFFICYRLQQKNILPGSAWKFLIVCALAIGLAVLTKGPVAILIFFLSAIVYWISERGRAPVTFKHAVLFSTIFAVTGCSWFMVEIIRGHADIVTDFIKYQIRLFKTGDAGHGGPIYFHLLPLLFGCFPASVFAIQGMIQRSGDDKRMHETRRWMAILFWVVLILFSIAKTKIIHYSSLCYYPLTFFAAIALYKLVYESEKAKKALLLGMGFIGLIIGIVIFLLPIIGMNKQLIPATLFSKDPFAAANLQADVLWSYADCLPGLLFIASVLTALILFHREKMQAAVIALFTGTMITTYSLLAFTAPKIEEYTQQAAVEFYENLKGKDVYVATLGYKSFVQLFCFDEPPQPPITQWGNYTNNRWLLDGDIDKPAYFSAKIDVADDYKKNFPKIRELYRKNGFVFFMRNPDPK